MGVGEDGLVAVDAVEVAERLLFLARVATQELGDRWFEIVVDDTAGDATPELEGPALPQQKGVLPLGGEGGQEHRAREAQPRRQEGNLPFLACQSHHGVAKVHLAPLGRGEGERDIRFRLRHFPARDAPLPHHWRTVDSATAIPIWRNSTHMWCAVQRCFGARWRSRTFSSSHPSMCGTTWSRTGVGRGTPRR